VLAFPGAGGVAEPESVYSENAVFFMLGDSNDEASRFQRIYDQVWSMTVDAEASIDMIRRAQAQLTTERS
jgi:hypothetical protein